VVAAAVAVAVAVALLLPVANSENFRWATSHDLHRWPSCDIPSHSTQQTTQCVTSADTHTDSRHTRVRPHAHTQTRAHRAHSTVHVGALHSYHHDALGHVLISALGAVVGCYKNSNNAGRRMHHSQVSPTQILANVALGIDLFDGPYPVTVAEAGYGLVFRFGGSGGDVSDSPGAAASAGGDTVGAAGGVDGKKRAKINLWERTFRDDLGPITEGCPCVGCTRCVVLSAAAAAAAYACLCRPPLPSPPTAAIT
jgi:queuine/archaeosine tRNA-ribosyltransferase